MKTASAFVTVRCRGCNEPREVTARTARRAGLCRACLHPPKNIDPTDSDRRWWLKRFSDTELSVLASELAGRMVEPSTFTPHRVALLGSATQPETRQ